jgi:hypothetical protein
MTDKFDKIRLGEDEDTSTGGFPRLSIPGHPMYERMFDLAASAQPANLDEDPDDFPSENTQRLVQSRIISDGNRFTAKLGSEETVAPEEELDVSWMPNKAKWIRRMIGAAALSLLALTAYKVNDVRLEVASSTADVLDTDDDQRLEDEIDEVIELTEADLIEVDPQTITVTTPPLPVTQPEANEHTFEPEFINQDLIEAAEELDFRPRNSGEGIYDYTLAVAEHLDMDVSKVNFELQQLRVLHGSVVRINEQELLDILYEAELFGNSELTLAARLALSRLNSGRPVYTNDLIQQNQTQDDELAENIEPEEPESMTAKPVVDYKSASGNSFKVQIDGPSMHGSAQGDNLEQGLILRRINKNNEPYGAPFAVSGNAIREKHPYLVKYL